MIDYKKIFKDREFRLKLINCLRFIPIKPYLKMVFWIKTGKKLNLKAPKTFCDKLNWLKFNDVHPEYTDLVDKVKVRDYVNGIMGQDMFFPLYGAWDHYADIDFDSLPDKFVLKCNHDSASVNVIKDKSSMNHTELEKFYEGRLKINPYNMGREYPYKDVKPKIIAEKYMVPDGESDINDYKFFCFDGKPELMFVATDRSDDCRFDFYDMDFNHLDIENIHPNSDKPINKPEKFEEMKALAAKLTQGFKFVRLDLYEIQGKIYFGEYTFFHAGGFWPFHPEKYEKIYGDLIKID
ncbi:MAG: glycosyl transferase [Oscillospiraceae bacterium]|nr:glycosyl transferase [Oscillospiraceae bacterium]